MALAEELPIYVLDNIDKLKVYAVVFAGKKAHFSEIGDDEAGNPFYNPLKSLPLRLFGIRVISVLFLSEYRTRITLITQINRNPKNFTILRFQIH